MEIQSSDRVLYVQRGMEPVPYNVPWACTRTSAMAPSILSRIQSSGSNKGRLGQL